MRSLLIVIAFGSLVACRCDEPVSDTPDAACVPTTCADLAKNCGDVADGCGGTLSCGTCTAPETCGASGEPNVCGCTATTCAQQGKNCGLVSNGCGGSVDCGACASPNTCGPSNVCSCVPDTCADYGKNCGTIPSRCGGSLDCGACTSPDTCGGAGTANVCGCVPTTCAAAGATCGTVSNGCGQTLNCGTCASPNTCGGGGQANTCGYRAATVAAAERASCIVTQSGGAKCTGRNDRGQLGDGTNTDRKNLVDVVGLSSGVARISGRDEHFCAQTTTGGVSCWGNNFAGQLGDATLVAHNTPVSVVGLAGPVDALSVGSDHTCALIDGGVQCWGSNQYGQVGTGGGATQLSPAAPSGLSSGVSQIAVGCYHSCALTTGGGVKCWGNNGNGRLGDGSGNNQPTPVDVTGLKSGVVSVASGCAHTCAALSTGRIRCWGYGAFGQLGNGGFVDETQSVEVTGIVGGIRSLTMGGVHSCALTVEGLVKCWGDNRDGQIGDSTQTNRATPINVTLGGVAVDLVGGNLHTCAVLDDGRARCWGLNSRGQLGDGTNTSRSLPVDVLFP